MAHATEPRGGRRRRWPSRTRDARRGRCGQICRSGGRGAGSGTAGEGKAEAGMGDWEGWGKYRAPEFYGDGVLQVGVVVRQGWWHCR